MPKCRLLEDCTAHHEGKEGRGKGIERDEMTRQGFVRRGKKKVILIH